MGLAILAILVIGIGGTLNAVVLINVGEVGG